MKPQTMLVLETAERLTAQKKMQSAKVVLGGLLDTVLDPEDMSLSLYDSGVQYFESFADAVKARELWDQAYEVYRGHPELMEVKPARKILAYLCENRMLVSLSYDEYENWAERLRELSPAEPILQEQLREVREQHDKGTPWSGMMQLIAGAYYNRNDPALDVGRYAQAAGIYDLLLENRRALRLNRTDWWVVLYEYVALMQRLALAGLRAMEEARAVYADEILFYLQHARKRLDEFIESHEPDEAVQRLSTSTDTLLEGLPEQGQRGLAPSTQPNSFDGNLITTGGVNGDLITPRDWEKMRRLHPELPSRQRLVGSCLTTLAMIGVIVYVIGKIFGWW